MRISRRRLACLPWILALAAAGGCDDPASRSDGLACCDAGARPHFLSSKTDDDDGDGNPNDEDFPAVNDEDDDIADHAWIRDDAGLYHLFFQNEGHGSGSDIEHYTSADLQTLDHVGIALARSPGAWDADGLWAPHVVRHGAVYAMFYTGVEGRGAGARQRIGLATSTDLRTWTRVPVNTCSEATGDGCVYECDERWTTWSGPRGAYNQQCRDPFVLWDPDHRRWVLFATAKSTNQYGVVTVAYSTNLKRWTGAGYIDATRRLEGGIGAQTSGGQAENPYVLSFAGSHYLFFCDWQDPEDSVTVRNPRTMTQYATSPLLTADAAGSRHWTYRGYIPDPGVNAIEALRLDNVWILSQSISNEASGDYEHRRQLRLKCVLWSGRFAFETANVCFAPGAGVFDPMVLQSRTGPQFVRIR